MTWIQPGFNQMLCLCLQIKYESSLIANVVSLCGGLSSTVCIRYLRRKDNVLPNISAAPNGRSQYGGWGRGRAR